MTPYEQYRRGAAGGAWETIVVRPLPYGAAVAHARAAAQATRRSVRVVLAP